MAADATSGTGAIGHSASPFGPGSAELRDRALHLLSGGSVIGLGIISGVLSLIDQFAPPPISLLFMFGSLAISAVLLWYWWSVYQRRNAHFAWHDQLEPAILAWLEKKGVPVNDIAALRSSAALKERQISDALIIMWLSGSILSWVLILVWQLQIVFLVLEDEFFYPDELLDRMLASPFFILGCIVSVIAGIFGLYLTKHVLEDTRFHERRENILLRLLSEKAEQHDFYLIVPLERRRHIGWRSFWLQVFVFPLITCAIYLFWTMYYLVQDGTSHAEHHARWEEPLLEVLARDGITVGIATPSAALMAARPLSLAQVMDWGAPAQQTAPASALMQQAVAPPPIPSAAPPLSTAQDRLRQLDALKRDGLITEEEYQTKKRDILSDL